MEHSTHKRLSPSPQRDSPVRHASPANSVSWPHQNLPHSQHHQQHRQDQQHPNQQGLGSDLPSRSSSVSPPLNAPSTTPTSTATSTPPVTVHLQPPPPSTHHSGSQPAHSPPPTPPVSAGLPLPLPLFDQAALAVLAQTAGNPPNTPVTPGAFLVSDSEESESDQYEDAEGGSSHSDSEREDDFEEEREGTTTLSSGHWPHQQLRRSPRSATFVRGEGGVALAERRRRAGGRTRSSSESIESERGRSRPVERRRPSYLYRTDSAPARFLRLEGLGSVIIEAPKRAISARASGGVRVVDTRKRNKASRAAEGRQCVYSSSTSMRKPSAGFGERARVKKMLESKQMEALQTSSPPRDVAAFKDRRLPARPSSMMPTPREYYAPSRGDGSENPSPKAAVTPGRRAPSASSEPWRPSLETLSDPAPSMAARISDFPITPIALDLGALSFIADFDELSPTTPRAQNHRTPAPRAQASHSSLNKARRRAAQSSRSSSVSATSIRLRSGSVVTVIPPEQTAWQRTVYVAGPIRLNKFQRKATANADDLEAAAKSEVDGLWPRAPSKPVGIASLDAFQDALDSLDPKATFERRASDECALDDLAQYFQDWIPTTECEKDTIDSFWLGASDDEGSVSKSNRSSMGSEWHGAPAEAGKEGDVDKSTSDRYSTGTTTSSLAHNRLSVVSGGMGAVEVELRDEDASSSKRSSRISLRRSPSLRGKSINTSGSAEKKHKSRPSEGQRTRLRRLVMSAGGML
ncbi:uncharacterized protein J3D65DRAFT_615078 [Phyllosticta citribraziliensis]|uniref:Uncharacterized protein n=1 Tax=Phyllosticta citribraziliensis TaxID=989973 RepID=A0ABR1M5F0_9PEZI